MSTLERDVSFLDTTLPIPHEDTIDIEIKESTYKRRLDNGETSLQPKVLTKSILGRDVSFLDTTLSYPTRIL